MKNTIRHIFSLGVKEIIGIFRDPLLLLLILYSFSFSVYLGAEAEPDAIDHAAIAIVDEDNSPLSKRISDAFLPPLFRTPEKISRADIDWTMNEGKYTFIVVFPPNFQERLLAKHNPEIQINVDATRMSQAFTGNGYIQQIISREVDKFVRENSPQNQMYTANLNIRNRFNPNLVNRWGGALNQMVNSISMIALILTGAALIRERERGTLEHLLVMPVTSMEIMLSKIWSMSLIVFVVSWASLVVVVQHLLAVPIAGSACLFMVGVAVDLFAMTSLGIFLACFAKDMPQLGILLILVLLPLEILSGGTTSQANMPEFVQYVMRFAPSTYIVRLYQGILLRGADFTLVWQSLAQLFLVGALYFVIAWRRFRSTVAS